MDVADKIKVFMEEHGITQAHICRKTGIAPAKLNLTLNGKRRLTFEEYEVICWSLGVGVETFLEAKPPQQHAV